MAQFLRFFVIDDGYIDFVVLKFQLERLYPGKEIRLRHIQCPESIDDKIVSMMKSPPAELIFVDCVFKNSYMDGDDVVSLLRSKGIDKHRIVFTSSLEGLPEHYSNTDVVFKSKFSMFDVDNEDLN